VVPPAISSSVCTEMQSVPASSGVSGIHPAVRAGPQEGGRGVQNRYGGDEAPWAGRWFGVVFRAKLRLRAQHLFLLGGRGGEVVGAW